MPCPRALKTDWTLRMGLAANGEHLGHLPAERGHMSKHVQAFQFTLHQAIEGLCFLSMAPAQISGQLHQVQHSHCITCKQPSTLPVREPMKPMAQAKICKA